VIPGISLDGLYADNTQSLYEATSLLIDEGHRDIAVLAGNPKLQLARDRVAGYKLAFESRHIEYNRKNIFFSEFSKECGYSLTLSILAMDKRPTAILSNNNMLSLGCLKAIYEKRLRIPEDIAFLGYDFIEELNILQSNTTLVDKQAFEYGQNAMQLLLRRIETPDMAVQKIIISGKLVRRGSEKLVRGV
jgi:LacI family transcriptional regulator